MTDIMDLPLLKNLAALALVLVASSVNAHEGASVHVSASAEQSASRLRGSERVRGYFCFLICLTFDTTLLTILRPCIAYTHISIQLILSIIDF